MPLDPSDLQRATAISKRMTVRAYAMSREWCEACNVTLEDIQGPSRERWLSLARHGLMWVLRHRLGLSLPEIGLIVNKDHTSVRYGIAAEQARRDGETPAD